MTTSDAFWRAFKGLVVVTDDDKIAFTAAGRARFTSTFAKHGVNISSVRTLERFKQVMRVVTASQREKDNRELTKMLEDPATTAPERAVIRSMLKLPAGE